MDTTEWPSKGRFYSLDVFFLLKEDEFFYNVVLDYVSKKGFYFSHHFGAKLYVFYNWTLQIVFPDKLKSLFDILEGKLVLRNLFIVAHIQILQHH